MGIYKLMSLLLEKSPNAIKKCQLDRYSGRVIACDASMAIYQFLVSTQGFGNQENNAFQFSLTELTDKDGNKTGHLVGLFNRTLQFIENGIRPVWVFDGKPPVKKNGELARRKKLKEEAKDKQEAAEEEGNMEEALKMKMRTTTVTKQMIEDAKTMIRLLGLPIIEAPCEAEAQCAALCKSGKVFATATEDMDALTFGTINLLRGFNSKKEPITEINYDKMLEGLELNQQQFIDMCILCGCDYCDTIDGVGPITAYKLIKEYNTIENVIKHLEDENQNPKRKKKYIIPKEFCFEDARDLFLNACVDNPEEIKLNWGKPNEEELKKFLCEDKGFSESRVVSGLKRMKVALFLSFLNYIQKKDQIGFQSHLDQFFKITESSQKSKTSQKKTQSSTKKNITQKTKKQF